MRSFPRLATVGLLTAFSATVLAAPAQAATTGMASVTSATKVQYKAAKGKQNKVVVTRTGNKITIDDRVTIKAGKGCKQVKGDKTKVYCTTKKAPGRITVWTYDRNDKITNNTDVALSAFGGSGSDVITGGSGGDRLSGESGNDRIDARGGKDTVWDGAGNDTVYGGAGGDFLVGGAGRDKLYGGAGDDSLNGDDAGKAAADVLDGGADAYYGDFCWAVGRDKRVNCER